MGRRELASIGRRLAQLRAPISQRSQAEVLGVPERTYQTYEQDTRFPDQRTLLGVFSQGWDLTWVLAGVGPQRVDPRAVIEWLYRFGESDENRGFSEESAQKLVRNYKSAKFPVPAWVREELPELSLDDAREILHGSWHSVRKQAAGPGASHAVSGPDLMIAVELAEERLRRTGDWLPKPLFFDLVAELYPAVVKGLPFAEILGFEPSARDFEQQERSNDDGRQGVARADQGDPQPGAAGTAKRRG